MRRPVSPPCEGRHSGSAGLVLAAQMANFTDIRTVVIDRKDGPLEVGQADGVACRTVELRGFGLADRLVNEGYWVNGSRLAA